MSILSIRNLAAGYGTLPILFDVSLQVEPGEIVAIAGGNGAGKSTLLSCISGLLRPVSGGHVAFDGVDITAESPWTICRRGLHHVLERRRLAPYMSVRDNLRLSEASVPHRERRAWRQRFQELCETDPLVQSHGDRRAVELSGGQQQMIAVLRGMLAAPRVLLLDEPYQGLDLAVASRLTDLLLAEAARGCAVVLTEHRSEIIAGLGSRQVTLARGEVRGDAASAVPASSSERLVRR